MEASSLLSAAPHISRSAGTFAAGFSSVYRTSRREPNLQRRRNCLNRAGGIVACVQNPVTGNNQNLNRRDVVLFGLSSSLFAVFPSSALSASSESEVEEVKMDMLVDDINAYSFLYPTELPSNEISFKWIVSRSPERYSSAAPLSPDARQRIVYERVDMINNLVISVSIGPPNRNYLTKDEKSAWSAKDVADSVLSDRSSLRVTTSQRMQESSVLDAHASEIDGLPYWYYEYLIRKSPTKAVQESNLFRHFVASTVERDGYLYTLTASTLSKQWPKVGPFLQKTVDSFRLVPPTENYVPPYKDPWRFW